MTNPDRTPPRTYGNWRRPQSPGVYNLGTLGTIILITTPALAAIGFLADPRLGLGVLVVGALLLVPFLWKDKGGHRQAEVVVSRVAHWRSRVRGETTYLSGILAESHGSHRLPGVLAPSELVSTRDGFDQLAGIVVLPQTRHYTAVLRLDPEGASLVGPDQIDRWVAGYAAWLARLAHEPGLVGASITIETAADPGTRLANAIDGQRSPDAPALAESVLGTIASTYPSGAAQVTAWATATYQPSETGSRRRNRAAMINHLAARLPGLAQQLRSTGAGAARPMTSQEITDTVRVAYDPALSTAMENVHARGGHSGISWRDAGPKADLAGWDIYRHDSGISRVWSMDEAPRGTVLANVLEHLLAPHPLLPRKRVTLMYRPHAPGDAAQIVDRDLRTAQFTQKARGSARSDVDIRAAAQAAVEEAEGSGVTRVSMLVTVTASTAEELAEADTVLDGLQGTARMLLRPLYAGQRAGFAAQLPVGIVLPEHGLVPDTIRERT